MNDAQVNSIQKDLSHIFKETNDFLSLKNKKIFITGASGYIGKWLLFSFAYLNNIKGYNIDVIATSKNMLDCDIIKYLDTKDKFFFENIDVRNPFDIPSDVNYVLHLAGCPDRRLHASEPLGIISTNIDGTRNVLNAATRVESLEKVLVFSSGLVHGQQYIKENRIEYKPGDTLNFSSSYIDSKRVQENVCHIYSRQYQLPVSIVRPYSFIGPLQQLNRPWAINNFVKNALSNKNIKVLGNPNTLKSYIYPTDMINHILTYLISDNLDTPLELGAPYSIRLKEIAEIIRDNVKSPISIEYFDAEAKSVKQDFICDVLNNKNDIQFKDAICRTLDWYRLN
ncbi:NAD-dependent epimerase/dehydratase family protein [Aliivibrio fischeri]|uniref:NAD-dependent epimerase/dehydratase family protein n=1 Tax=Aliivibrio fischeri TaxID=668 RepID=UPI00080D8D84|nr:NAD(P)-dependent oxidoreductase [Aliivibrio fischeri]OCH37514.1 hypothetical protein A6D99_13705 [Aliivibrio fischeri]